MLEPAFACRSSSSLTISLQAYGMQLKSPIYVRLNSTFYLFKKQPKTEPYNFLYHAVLIELKSSDRSSRNRPYHHQPHKDSSLGTPAAVTTELCADEGTIWRILCLP